MQTPLMARLIRLLTACAVSIGLLLTTGAALSAPMAFAASPTSTVTLPDTPAHGVSTVTMRANGATVYYPARVYAGTPFLVMLSAPPTDQLTWLRLAQVLALRDDGVGLANVNVASLYVAAEGSRALDWQQIQRALSPEYSTDPVTLLPPPTGVHLRDEEVSWWVTLPHAGRYELQAAYTARAQEYSGTADFTVTSVEAPPHGAPDISYPYAATYRVWVHPGTGTLPEQITVVASATAPGRPPLVGTYGAAVDHPSTLSLPLPAPVAEQASALGTAGTVIDLVYIRTPRNSPAVSSYAAMLPTIRLWRPGQSAGGGGVWGWLTRIL